MKYPINFSILIFCLLNFDAIAQVKESREFLVTEKLDTLYGRVERTSKIFFKTYGLKFQLNQEDEAVFYHISDVKAYQNRQGHFFVRREFNSNDKTQREYRFLEILILGEINLYRTSSDFYVEKHGDIIQLRNTVTERKNEVDRIFLKKNKEYIATLSVLMGECVALYDTIKESNYAYEDFVALIKKYHDCVNKEYYLHHSEEEKLFKLDLGIGMSLIGLYSSSKNIIPKLRTEEIQKMNSLNLGVGIDVNLRFLSKFPLYFVFSPQITFNNRFSVDHKFDLTTIFRREYYADLQFNQLSLPMGIGYEIKSKTVQPIIEGGITYHYVWNGDYRFDAYTKSQLGDSRLLYSESYKVNSFSNVGYWFTIGANYKIFNNLNLFSKLAYQTTSFSTADLEMTAVDKKYNYQQYQLIFGIRF